MPESGERAKGSAGLAPSVLTNAVKCLTLSASCIGSIPIEIKWAGLDRGTAGRLRLVRHRPSASDNRLSATLMTGSLQPGWLRLGPRPGLEAKKPPIPLPGAQVGSGGVNG